MFSADEITGYAIIEQAKLLLEEDKSTEADMQSQLWPTHVKKAANFVARELDARHSVNKIKLNLNRGERFVSNNSGYPFPYKITGVFCYGMPGLVAYPLKPTDEDTLTADFPIWMSDNLIYWGYPTHYVKPGETADSTIIIWPPPSYSIQNGLIINGYVDCEDWKLGEPCPLGPTCAMAVKFLAGFYRCVEMKSGKNIYYQKEPDFYDLYLKIMATLRFNINSNKTIQIGKTRPICGGRR
jgi:hypothetical protein